MACVANARMYSVDPGAAAAWQELFDWLARESGVDLRVIDHAFPAPLADLWSRPDLGCAFMCGFPYKLAKASAAAGRGAGPARAGRCREGRSMRPGWWSRRMPPFRSLQDTFGGRLGFTVEDSHSGYNALRHHLLPYWRRRGRKLYRESIGPLTTPRRVIAAHFGRRDRCRPARQLRAGPDGRHDPALAATDPDRRRRRMPRRFRFWLPAATVPDELVAASAGGAAAFRRGRGLR